MADNKTAKQEPEHRPRRRRGCAGIFFAFLVIGGALAGACLGAFLWALDDAKTKITVLDRFRPKIGSKVYSDDGVLLGEFLSEEARQLVNLSEMPLHLQKAFIATEDDKFYHHKGVRPDAILNALLYIVRTGNLRGGSTITQQLVRNIDPEKLVSREQTVRRKVQEALVALQVERQYTKDEILELYLNQVFFGISAWGVEAAAQQYFAKSCRELTLGESAMLAGLTRAPNANEPLHHPENALRRRDIVLEQMLENEMITQEEYEAALAESLDDSVVTREERAQLKAAGHEIWTPRDFKAPYFVEDVRKFILHELGADKEDVFGNGLEIHTTLDMRMQEAAENALLPALDAFDEQKQKDLARAGREDEFVPVSGALVCIDNRPGFKGYIRAMVGGRDFSKEKYNTASQARRQPGSSVKPFVWAAAIGELGMTPSDIIIDEPYERIDGAGRIWAPVNFDGKFNGPMTLRRALEKSVNIVSIKLLERVGMPIVRSYMQRAGIHSPIDESHVRTLALGTAEVTALEHCTAYSTFANGGLRHEPFYVTEIKDRDGLTRDRPRPGSVTRAFPPEVAFEVTYLLEGVAQWGTGSRTRDLGRPRAGKTGTSNESCNVWFCGFTPDFTCVVWMGYRDNHPLGRGIRFTGGRLASPIWTTFLKSVYEVFELPVKDFDPPDGIVFYNVDRETGVLGGSFPEAFIIGTAPPTEMRAFQIGEEYMPLPASELLEKL